jgi:hypothetical protein
MKFVVVGPLPRRAVFCSVSEPKLDRADNSSLYPPLGRVGCQAGYAFVMLDVTHNE